MTSQYFDNSSNRDGWGDDWGDFNDDSNIVSNVPPQSNNPYSSGGKKLTSPNQNTIYGQQPSPQFATQNQYGMNNNPTTSSVQRPPPSGFSQQNVGYPQPNYPPSQQFNTNNYAAPTNMYGIPPPPQQQQKQSDNDNWTWNTPEHRATPDNIDNVFPKVSPAAVQKHVENVTGAPDTNINQSNNSTQYATNFNSNIQNLQSRTPDDLKNTQNIQNPALTRIKRSEHLLTPQWSTESQISQTSSDRSIESDNIDTRSSATNTSDEHGYGQSLHNQNFPPVPTSTDVENNQNLQYNQSENYNIGYQARANYPPPTSVPTQEENRNKNDLDSLDQALMNMNIVKSDESNYYKQDYQQISQHQQHPIVPPSSAHAPPPAKYDNPLYSNPPISSSPNPVPQSISPNLPQQAQYTASSKLITPPLIPNSNPPPSIYSAPSSIASSTMPLTSVPPSMSPSLLTASNPSQTQFTPQQGGTAAVNPFKRSNLSNPPRSAQYAAASIPSQSIMPSGFYHDPQSNQNFNVHPPDNSENLEVENLEIAPSNDRNQYLQTGHLSEESQTNEGIQAPIQHHESNDNLPPPGLSRFVLGQPGSENPPVGLDRMIPGTELHMELNVGRQADGQASSSNVPPPSSRLSERNLYPVPGESTAPSQRVIPGVEDDRRSSQLQQPIIQQHNEPEILINDQYREVNVEGENVADYPNQHQQNVHTEIREEPIEGANTSDEINPQVNLNQIETESNLTYDGPRKDLSNPSTANDDSDKEHLYYKSRRGLDEGSGSRRRGSNKGRGRYDTEDTDYSDRDRRRYREGSVRDDRSDRERDPKDLKDRPRGRRDGSGRDRERSDRDRYDRSDKDRNKYRYETDSSKYDNENRESKRRYDDYDRRRDDRDRDDRRYKKGDRDRDDRRRDDNRSKYRDDRRRDRGDRSKYEYDDEHNHRSSSRNGGGQRDSVEKDRRYQQGYYQTAGYGQYDPYTYYQQQQQYYESLRRTNPQAYMEMYKKYFSQMQNQVPTDLINADGRESVHSGRSSANDKDRYVYHYNIIYVFI